MKKRIAVILCALLAAAAISGCAAGAGGAEPVKIAALQGPTGMGMAGLMGDEMKDRYSVELSSAPDDVSAKFISGGADIAAVPINLASVLYNKTGGDAVMIAVNTLGVLYVLENGESVNSVADLAGKTLYATGQGATPEYVINYILEKNGVADEVTVEYKAEHSELAALMAGGDADLGMLPEPNVTAVMMKNDALRVALDLTKEWDAVSDTALVQGCLIVKKSFAEENGAVIDAFLADYAASVAFVNEHGSKASLVIADKGIISDVAVAKAAIKGCNIVCMTGAEMRAAAEGMLGVLFEANPKSVGGALPGAEFYYGG